MSDPDKRYPCCKHCDHDGATVGHFYPCGGPACIEAEQHVADIERDEARIRAELDDRLNRCTDYDTGLAFGWLIDNHPDLIREALDETGAPN